MKNIDEQFKTSLREMVEKTESRSGVELVVAIIPRSGTYNYVALLAGTFLSMLVLTVMMFVPTEFWHVHIYLETVVSFFLGAGIVYMFPGITRMIIGKKTMHRNTETHARAIFQKAGIMETHERIGVLVMFSWFEKDAYIVPDTGAAEVLPPDELEAMETRFRAAFNEKNVRLGILEALEATIEKWEAYIPQDGEKINELPDELWLN